MSAVAEAELERLLRRVDRVLARPRPGAAEAFVPDHRVRSICAAMAGLASRLRALAARRRARAHPAHRAHAIENIRRRGRQQVDTVVRQIQPILGRLSRADLDALVGCLARVEHATGQRIPSLDRLRARVGPKLGVR